MDCLGLLLDQLVRQHAARISLQRLGEDVFERIEIGVIVEDGRASIAPVEGMADRVFLVSTFGSRHLLSLHPIASEKRVLTPFLRPERPLTDSGQ